MSYLITNKDAPRKRKFKIASGKYKGKTVEFKRYSDGHNTPLSYAEDVAYLKYKRQYPVKITKEKGQYVVWAYPHKDPTLKYMGGKLG